MDSLDLPTHQLILDALALNLAENIANVPSARSKVRSVFAQSATTSKVSAHTPAPAKAAVQAPRCTNTKTGSAATAKSTNCQPCRPKNQPIRSRWYSLYVAATTHTHSLALVPYFLALACLRLLRLRVWRAGTSQSGTIGTEAAAPTAPSVDPTLVPPAAGPGGRLGGSGGVPPLGLLLSRPAGGPSDGALPLAAGESR